MPPVCARCQGPRLPRVGNERFCPACAPHAVWLKAIQLAWNEDQVRVRGVLYEIHRQPPEDPLNFPRPTGGLGFGGRLFTIRFKDGRLAKTRNLWEIGRIPAGYSDALPDNATFVGRNKKEVDDRN